MTARQGLQNKPNWIQASINFSREKLVMLTKGTKLDREWLL